MTKLVLKTFKRNAITTDVHETFIEVDMDKLDFLKKVLKKEIPKKYFLDHPILKYGSFTTEFKAKLIDFGIVGPSDFVSLSFYSEPTFIKLEL